MLTVEPLSRVNVAEVVAWITGIDLRSWPQQSHRELKPAMVTDLAWFGMGERTESLVDAIMQDMPGCLSFQRMLSMVMPGHSIDPHRDHQAPYWMFRVHIPLVTNERSRFIVGGHHHHLDVGHAYKVNTEVEHAVENGGDTPRIHFMFDVGRK
jgi:hypothetical protein